MRAAGPGFRTTLRLTATPGYDWSRFGRGGPRTATGHRGRRQARGWMGGGEPGAEPGAQAPKLLSPAAIA